MLLCSPTVMEAAPHIVAPRFPVGAIPVRMSGLARLRYGVNIPQRSSGSSIVGPRVIGQSARYFVLRMKNGLTLPVHVHACQNDVVIDVDTGQSVSIGARFRVHHAIAGRKRYDQA
jgi:hypothetical protein